MAEKEADKNSKDWWDKAEIVSKVIAGLLTGLALATVGIFSSSYLNDRQNNELRWRLYTELISNREQAESALRKDMFNSIINTYISPTPSELEQKLLDLELLTYNFHESICIKPLYIHLSKLINENKNISDSLRNEYYKRLIKVASEITEKQAMALEAVGKSFEREFSLAELPLRFETVELVLDSITRSFSIEILEINKEKREMEVEVEVYGDGERFFSSFGVSPFDFPMIDNTRLTNDQRFAIILNRFDESTATITLIYFPGTHASLKEKPYYQDVINRLMKKPQEI